MQPLDLGEESSGDDDRSVSHPVLLHTVGQREIHNDALKSWFGLNDEDRLPDLIELVDFEVPDVSLESFPMLKAAVEFTRAECGLSPEEPVNLVLFVSANNTEEERRRNDTAPIASVIQRSQTSLGLHVEKVFRTPHPASRDLLLTQDLPTLAAHLESLNPNPLLVGFGPGAPSMTLATVVLATEVAGAIAFELKPKGADHRESVAERVSVPHHLRQRQAASVAEEFARSFRLREAAAASEVLRGQSDELDGLVEDALKLLDRNPVDYIIRLRSTGVECRDLDESAWSVVNLVDWIELSMTSQAEQPMAVLFGVGLLFGDAIPLAWRQLRLGADPIADDVRAWLNDAARLVPEGAPIVSLDDDKQSWQGRLMMIALAMGMPPHADVGPVSEADRVALAEWLAVEQGVHAARNRLAHSWATGSFDAVSQSMRDAVPDGLRRLQELCDRRKADVFAQGVAVAGVEVDEETRRILRLSADQLWDEVRDNEYNPGTASRRAKERWSKLRQTGEWQVHDGEPVEEAFVRTLGQVKSTYPRLLLGEFVQAVEAGCLDASLLNEAEPLATHRLEDPAEPQLGSASLDPTPIGGSALRRLVSEIVPGLGLEQGGSVGGDLLSANLLADSALRIAEVLASWDRGR